MANKRYKICICSLGTFQGPPAHLGAGVGDGEGADDQQKVQYMYLLPRHI